MKTPVISLFSLDEYRVRLNALRTRMADTEVDALIVNTPENLFYLTGYQTPGYGWWQCLIVPSDGEPVFVTRLIESANIHPLTWVEESRPYDDREDPIGATVKVLNNMNLGTKRIGIDKRNQFFAIGDYERLTGSLPKAVFVDCSGQVELGRMVKSRQEIEYMRQAARVADVAMVAAIDSASAGVTDNSIAAAAHYAQISAGGEYTGMPMFVCSGYRSNLTHATWGRNVLQPQEALLLEIPGCINRYHAALFRPVFIGDPPDDWLRAAQLSIACLEYAKSLIRPGVSGAEVREGVTTMLREGGSPMPYESVGMRDKVGKVAYSIGIAFEPDWGEHTIYSFDADEHRPLVPGMTFHLVAANIRVPKYGRAACTDTVLVTDNGCEALTTHDRSIYVK